MLNSSAAGFAVSAAAAAAGDDDPCLVAGRPCRAVQTVPMRRQTTTKRLVALRHCRLLPD